MITLVRTDSQNPAFIDLVRQLDADLTVRDGWDNVFYAQFNKIDMIRHAVVAYQDDVPVGCGAMKAFSEDAMEVKRMFVSPLSRKAGIASRIIQELEAWVRELSYARCVLETGKRQPEAIGLYRKQGYRQIPNYGQYIGVENSVCFEKMLA